LTDIDLNNKELLIIGLVRALDAAIFQMQADAVARDVKGRTSRQIADDGDMHEAHRMAIGVMVHARMLGYKP